MDNAKDVAVMARAPKKQSQLREFWRMFLGNKPAVVGLVVVLLLLGIAYSAELFVPYEEALKQNISGKVQPPSAEHWFGTDKLGRDVFYRVLHGAKTSLTMGFIPTFISMLGGMLLGGLAAYLGGWVDNLIMRICDTFACIPGILLALCFVAALGPGLRNMLIAITISSIPGSTRYVRALVLNIVELDFVEAARACGSGTMSIVFKHVIPNAVGPLVLGAASSIAGMIMTGAGLSFLGLGLQPPHPEWGFMLAENQNLLRTAPYLMLAPGLCILVSVLCFNLVGDGLRDALDPKLRR